MQMFIDQVNEMEARVRILLLSLSLAHTGLIANIRTQSNIASYRILVVHIAMLCSL